MRACLSGWGANEGKAALILNDILLGIKLRRHRRQHPINQDVSESWRHVIRLHLRLEECSLLLQDITAMRDDILSKCPDEQELKDHLMVYDSSNAYRRCRLVELGNYIRETGTD